MGNAQTKGKISKIIDGNIPDGMVMYLINAIYFKGAWKYTFDKSKTSSGNFRLDDGQNTTVSYMMEKLKMNISVTPSANAYELMYGNSKFSMVIVVPKDNISLNDFIHTMDKEKWATLTSKMWETDSYLRLPKFKFEYKIKLNNALTNLGMGIAFKDGAEFSRINPQERLSITEVMHKTFIEVN